MTVHLHRSVYLGRKLNVMRQEKWPLVELCHKVLYYILHLSIPWPVANSIGTLLSLTSS